MRKTIGLYFLMLVLFVGTFIFFSDRQEVMLSDLERIKITHERVAALAADYIKLKDEDNRNRRVLERGLLSFVQDKSAALGVSEKITAIRTIHGGREAVNVIYHGLTYSEIVEILMAINHYADLRVKVFSISQRFDSPEFADLNIQIEML
ncbi:hypothetical protein M1N53_03100 [Thermodesulfovibrionales bacterium]|nr:hypothetical protein [Thermodesulfovibrionales bacterium]